jgi:hypothetical protein
MVTTGNVTARQAQKNARIQNGQRVFNPLTRQETPMREEMTLELDVDVLHQLMLMAHERDVTLNDLINTILEEHIAKATQPSWVVQLEALPNGDLFLPLPEELVALQGWKIGDTLLWEDLGDGRWGLTLAQP